jgi:hypothetical protein
MNCYFSKWNGNDTANQAKYSIVKTPIKIDRNGFKTGY